MKAGFLFLFLCLTTFSLNSQIKIKSGRWLATMQINEKDLLPFELSVSKEKDNTTFTVVNGEEKIQLTKAQILSNDTIQVEFPYFKSQLRFKVVNKKKISGRWYNLYKKNYSIPFTASFNKKSTRFSQVGRIKNSTDFSGKWKVYFEPGTTGQYPAVGLFEKSGKRSEVSGTFLTETGDYRFLSGNASKDSLFLSCFDGSHAFMFKAVLKNDSLHGQFFSGSHWQSDWIATRNDKFELTAPEDLTTVTDKPLAFELKDLNGKSYSYPNKDLQGKVVIIQIMGSWCPNCLDETHYFKDLYTKYHDKGLEIIAVGYETGDSFDQHASNIMRLKEKLALDFTFLVGGTAKKALASEHFSALNHIISFPTSIIIDRNGVIRRVHTGFNGPGTGSHYTEYVENTNSLIEGLLAE